MSPEPAAIRDARDADSAQVIELVAACWSEYPGVILDVDREAPELRRIAGHYAERRGRLWVAESAGRIVGSVGLVPARDPRGVELQRLYVAPAARRQGLGARLCALVEAEARGRGAAFVELWTDTRFRDAHRLYERLGYLRGPRTRELRDLSRSVEYHYRKELAAGLSCTPPPGAPRAP